MESLKQAAVAELSNLPSGVMASLYRTGEERIGVVRVERVDGKVRLVSAQEEGKGNEAGKAGNEASSSASNGDE